MKVVWTVEARTDRIGILEHIAADNPAAARRLNGLFDKATDRLARFPFSTRPGKITGTREMIPHPSYRLVYEVQEDRVLVVAVIHSARQWPPAEQGDG